MKPRRAFGNGLDSTSNISIVIDQTSGSVAYDGLASYESLWQAADGKGFPKMISGDAEVSDCATNDRGLPEYCGATDHSPGRTKQIRPKTVHWDLAFAAH